LFKGEDINNFGPADVCRKGIGRSFQLTSVFPSLTALENIQLALLSHWKKNSALFSNASKAFVEEAGEILNSVGLYDQIAVIAERMSHGDKRRLDIAIALATKSELLLLDEPTSGMAPSERIKVMNLIEKLFEERGLTVIFIEHDLDIIFSVARKILVMHQGSIIAEGTPEQIKMEEEVQRIYLGGV
jgi:branched-chain amino acid transport system ATP-binding protein